MLAAPAYLLLNRENWKKPRCETPFCQVFFDCMNWKRLHSNDGPPPLPSPNSIFSRTGHSVEAKSRLSVSPNRISSPTSDFVWPHIYCEWITPGRRWSSVHSINSQPYSTILPKSPNGRDETMMNTMKRAKNGDDSHFHPRWNEGIWRKD